MPESDDVSQNKGYADDHEIDVVKDLVFATHDGVDLKADVYTPQGPGPFPALVLIHGGGWQRGSKNQWSSWGAYFAKHGYVAFAVSYRLSSVSKPTFYESLSDVQSGVQYLRGRAADLKVDPERIGGMGVSAGAHLVAMLGLIGDSENFLNPTIDEPYSRFSAKLDVVIPVAGIYDMIQQWEHDQLHRPGDHITVTYLGGTPMDLRERFYLSSPLYHASSQNGHGTSWLVVWGDEDDIVDHEPQSMVFAQHLKRAGATVRLLPLTGAGHFWIVDAEPEEGRFNPAFGTEVLLFLQNWSGWWPRPRL